MDIGPKTYTVYGVAQRPSVSSVGPVPDANWWRGFLRGRAKAFTRQNVTISAVAGAIEGAQREGVSDAEINEILVPFGLTWDSAEGRVLVRDQPPRRP